MTGSFETLPFDEAIKYSRQKISLPTQRWTDLWEGMHARAFVVAGATKQELLGDLRGSIDKAISDGMTLADFRKDFDQIVSRHGWSYRGKRGWRTGVIYNTNLRTAYAAGRYKQMTDKDVVQARPYWRYIGGLSREPRPEHLFWSGTVLPHDDPWWENHYPPNGWGCKCKVVTHSEREVERLKQEGVVKRTSAPQDHYTSWKNPRTGQILRVPRGIDPGWNYNVGEAAWGREISKTAMEEWRNQGAAAWERLTPATWETLERPRVIPADPAQAALGPRLATAEATRNSLKKILGGEEKVFSFTDKGFRHDVLVNAESLAQHIDLSRTPFLPFLPETMENPYEVWLSFERHKGTGQVALRQRIIKAVETENKRGMLVVAQSKNGIMEAWTIIPTSDLNYSNQQRQGKLIWSR